MLVPAAAVLFLSSPASAGEPRQVPRTTLGIEIDGRVDDPAWDAALSISLDYEFEPGENVPAPAATECLLTYDTDHLYVAFRAHDPEPEKIRARLADRDAAFSDDFVGVVLDTFNDRRRAVELFVNPLGVQMDLVLDDVNGDDDPSWDTLWQSAGRLTGSGYEVELAVPFSSLRFPRSRGVQTWGFDAIRHYPRSFRHRLASNPRDRGIDCYLCQIDKIQGFEGASPGRNVEINPTLTAGRTDRRREFPRGPFESGGEEADLGLTVRWGITPDLTLSGTVNPDFSQVEADVAQLDVNTRFALFFPERRPFFLEGADLFDTPESLVFTRNVADPAWGLKLTGKQGANAHGAFFTRDRLTNLLFPGTQGSDAGSFDFPTDGAVARYRRDLGKSSTFGAIVTSREGRGYSNRVASVEGLFRFTEADSMRAQISGSRTEYPAEIATRFEQPAGAFDDHALFLAYDHDSRDWRWYALYRDVGEGFRADLGFLPRVGFSNLEGGVERIWWGGEGDFYSEMSLGAEWDRLEDPSGRLLEEEWEVSFEVEGPKQTELELEAGVREQAFGGVTFEDQTFLNGYFEIQPTGRLFLGVFAGIAEAIDFAETRPGDELRIAPELRYDFGRHLRLSLSHEIQRLEVDGGRLFEANLSQGRLLYQLNLRTFLRAIFQYTSIDRDPSLFSNEVEAESEQLFSQLLFSYKLNPRTVLFLGYSDNALGDHDAGLTQESRTLFFKLGYAWVL